MIDEREITLTSGPRRFLFIMLLDLAILAELCIAMRQAAMTPDALTPVFVKTFFIMLLPTLAVGFAVSRWMRRSKPEQAAS